MQIGDRVGAVLKTDEKQVFLFGFGLYAGKQVPPPGIQFLGMDMQDSGQTNPKLVLDDGQIVWGCECWWGPEEKVKTMLIGNREVVWVNIEEVRGTNSSPDIISY